MRERPHPTTGQFPASAQNKGSSGKYLRQQKPASKYGLEAPRTKWETPPTVVENDQAPVGLPDPDPDKMLMANQTDIVVVNKQQKETLVIDVAIPSDANIR